MEKKATFIDDNQVDNYFAEHGIKVSKLNNGLTLIGANRFVPDANRAKFEIMFPTGAYFDPPGKQGILHVYEHLISNRPGITSKISEGFYNAHTRIDEMRIFAKGVASPNVREYGYWPIIEAIYKELDSPIIPTEDRLETEKKVVYEEYYRRVGNGKSHKAQKHRMQLLFGSGAETLDVDSIEGVSAVTVDDIKKLQSNVFVANGAVAEVLVEGNPELFSQVFSELEEGLSKMEKGSPVQKFDYELYKETNPDFQHGSLNAIDDGSESGNLSFNYIWKIPMKKFTPEAFAQSRLLDTLGTKWFDYTRQKGLGYNAGRYNMSTNQKSFDGYRFAMLHLDASRITDHEGYARAQVPQIKDSIIKTLDDQELENLLYRISLQVKAMPITIHQRLHDVVYGLTFYGAPIDSQYSHDNLLGITKKHLITVRDMMLELDPAIIVTGDLKTNNP